MDKRKQKFIHAKISGETLKSATSNVQVELIQNFKINEWKPKGE